MTSTKAWFVRYDFTLPDGQSKSVTINLDAQTLAIVDPMPTALPAWTALDVEQCPNCPFTVNDCATCPIAARLSGVVDAFKDLFSYQKVSVKVTVPERSYVVENTSIQKALSSLLGIFMVTSGCPVLSRLRPMVRFHLPVAQELETLVRSTSMYLLRQYFVARDGGTPDWSLEGLARDYQATGQVNRAFARRLRAAGTKDANVNALIVLHTYAEALPDTIDDQLEELKYLFTNAKEA